DLIRDIQTQMGRVAGEIAQSEAASRKADEIALLASKKNQAVEDLLGEILAIRQVVVAQIKEVHTAIEEDAKEAQRVAEIVAAVEQQIEEASHVAQEQAKAIEELANSIEEIASIADEMQVG
ncbi:MAG: chemotaxis protein, partial [Syntrophomonadaceae bacterium]|nr:chemotaxis protein [Syntrophomonadaceae bacterium]